MSAPELPPGWEISLGMLDEQLDLDDQYVDQLVRLAKIHQRYIGMLGRGALDYVYAFARHQLGDRYDLPAAGPYQAMFYQKMSAMWHAPIGGGLQYNVNVGGQSLAVRAQVYRLGEESPHEPLPPFDCDQAEEIYLLVDGVKKACETRGGFLWVESDLATIMGDPLPSQIVSVAPLSS